MLVRQRLGGAREDVTPAPFNVRTRVHEYGGGAYAARDDVVVAVDFADQRLYRLGPGAGQALTPESGGRLRYADLEPDPAGGRVFAVREDHRGGGEPVNAIVLLDLDRGGEGQVLAHGRDFFSSPRLSPDRRQLAWLSWDHPDMPWDATTLWQAEIGANGALGPARAVAGASREAIVQPAWSPNGQLYFVSDRTGWWNLYRATDSGAYVCLPDVCRICRASLDVRRTLVRLPRRRCAPGLLSRGWTVASGTHRSRQRTADANRCRAL